jgi:hypothetical protein
LHGVLLLILAGWVNRQQQQGLGGEADVRDRPTEFSEPGLIPKDELLRSLDAVVSEAKEVLGRLTVRQLLEARRIQGFDVTGPGPFAGAF